MNPPRKAPIPKSPVLWYNTSAMVMPYHSAGIRKLKCPARLIPGKHSENNARSGRAELLLGFKTELVPRLGRYNHGAY
jgi:hypothetical protein